MKVADVKRARKILTQPGAEFSNTHIFSVYIQCTRHGAKAEK